MAELAVSVHWIKEQPQRFELEAPAAWWEDTRALLNEPDLALLLPFRASLEAYRIGNRLLFRGAVSGSLELDCGLCAVRYRKDFSEPLELLLEPAGAKQQVPASGIELDPEDLELGHYSGDELDFGPLIQEILALAWPVQPRCSDECRGLCPVCGRNRNESNCNCMAGEKTQPFSGLDKLLEQSHKNPRRSDRSGR